MSVDVMGEAEACRRILALIRSDLVDTIMFDHAGTKICELEEMGSLSTGERVLVDIARAVWSGSGGASIGALGRLDRDTAHAVIAILDGRFGAGS